MKEKKIKVKAEERDEQRQGDCGQEVQGLAGAVKQLCYTKR
jgi:hypothetical protein